MCWSLGFNWVSATAAFLQHHRVNIGPHPKFPPNYSSLRSHAGAPPMNSSLWYQWWSSFKTLSSECLLSLLSALLFSFFLFFFSNTGHLIQGPCTELCPGCFVLFILSRGLIKSLNCLGWLRLQSSCLSLLGTRITGAQWGAVLCQALHWFTVIWPRRLWDSEPSFYCKETKVLTGAEGP